MQEAAQRRYAGRAPLGAVAQLAERLLCKEKVRSSNLLGSTRPRSSADRAGEDGLVSWKIRRRVARCTDEEVSPRITSFRMIVRSSPCTPLCRARTRANGEP